MSTMLGNDHEPQDNAGSTDELKFQSLLESAPDAIVIVGKDGDITLLNSQAEQMLGYGRAELIGKPIEILVPQDLRASHSDHRKDYSSNPRTRHMGTGMELRALDKHGREFPVEISLSPLRTKEGLLVISVIRDISERKGAELALKESEQKFREFVEGTDDLVTRIDSEGRFIYINKAAEEVFGLEPEVVVGRSAFDFVHPEDRDETKEAFAQWINQGVRSATFENRQIGIDGKVHHMLWTINPRYDEDGELTSVTSIAREITDRKRLEQSERDRLEAQLLLENERTKARMRREVLRRSIAAQEDERRRIARELHDETAQSLTSVILGLRRIRSAKDLGTARREAEISREAVIQALRELRSLATRLRPTALDDLGLIPALEVLTGQAPAPDETSISFLSDGVDRRLDPAVETTIYRVVQEALTNAGKYARAHKISIEVLERKGAIYATVSDDGCGFDPDSISTGSLGLAGMQERASLVGGELRIETEPGNGTEIALKIPLRQ